MWESSKLAVFVNFSDGVTVPVVLYFEGWSTKAVFAFVDISGIARASSGRTTWHFQPICELVLTCIFRCGKFMRPCVVSVTTLLILIKCKPMIGPVSLFFSTKCSTNVLSPVSILNVVVANRFSNWPFATCTWKSKGRRFWRCCSWPFVLLCPIHFEYLHWSKLLILPRHLLLRYGWNPETHINFPVCGWEDCRI